MYAIGRKEHRTETAGRSCLSEQETFIDCSALEEEQEQEQDEDEDILLLFLDYCHRDIGAFSTTLTEVFPCFFLSCKVNARV
jgi:hypothetical protein